jgi:transposase
MTMFLNLLHRWESAELNQEEAAELLGVSERTFRRWPRRYERARRSIEQYPVPPVVGRCWY